LFSAKERESVSDVVCDAGSYEVVTVVEEREAIILQEGSDKVEDRMKRI
jgi:hypothetical protein